METSNKVRLLELSASLASPSVSDRVVETIRIFDILISKIDAPEPIDGDGFQADTPKRRGRPPKA